MSHIEARDAAGIVMLAAGDPERAAAFAHAAHCPHCRDELARAEHTLSALSALDVCAPPPSVGGLAQRERALLAVLSPDRVRTRRAAPRLLLVLVALAALLVSLAPRMAGLGSVPNALPLKCALSELVVAVLPFAVLAYVRRRSELGPSEGALATGTFALVAELWLVGACPDRSLVHQLVFHAGAVLLAMALGALGSLGLRAARAR